MECPAIWTPEAVKDIIGFTVGCVIGIIVFLVFLGFTRNSD